MKKFGMIIAPFLISLTLWGTEVWTEERGPAQKRILMERGEKVKGQRLALGKRVIEK